MGIGTVAGIPVKTTVSDIVVNTNGKMVFGCFFRQLFIHRRNHAGCKFFGREAVAPPYNRGHTPKTALTGSQLLCYGGYNILV